MLVQIQQEDLAQRGSASQNPLRGFAMFFEILSGFLEVGKQKVGYGMVADGIAKFQVLNFRISGPESEISSKIPCFAG